MLHYASPGNVNILCFGANDSLRFLFCPNILKNKGFLMMVQWRTLKIHGIFSFHKRFFIDSIHYSNVLYTNKKMVLLKNIHWKVFWGPKIVLVHHRCETRLWPYQDITRNSFCLKRQKVLLINSWRVTFQPCTQCCRSHVFGVQHLETKPER